MASPARPSTPRGQTAQPPVSTPPTGTWRHPRFDEIARRQNASTFSDRNVKKILWNGGFLLATFFCASFAQSYPQIHNLLTFLSPFSHYPIILLRLLLVFNILAACSPLIRRKDDLADIPLTPSQRALLGLDPRTSTPATPGTQYITPPRYARSSTPRSGTPGSGSSSTYSSSPLSGKGSPSMGRAGTGSPFSPSPSPLLQKAIGGGARDFTRRQSYGSQSPLGASMNGRESGLFGTPTSPSPTTGKGASVGLNSRWLYERGRASSGSSRGVYS